MSKTVASAGLLSTATLYWRYFALAWLMPVALVAAGATGLINQATFSLAIIHLFFLGQFLAYLPRRRGQVGYWQLVFWAIFVPLLIWAALVFGIGLTQEALAGP